ncbi:MAG: molecular chaperone HtpG, partial [Erysipelotrichales bacterium]|nr:molecular chaperone HtpG [Erysipelotrichales bacterium]
EEEKKEKEELKKTNEPMLNAMKDALAGKVSDVRISTHLTDYPVCLTADEGISFEMEKTLRNVPNGGMGLKATKILEVNPNHPLFETLKKIYEKDPSKLGKYAGLLYSQALLIEGFPIEDAVEYSRLVCEMMVDAAKE